MAEEDAICWDEAYSVVDDYDTRKKEMIPDETELDYLSFYVDLPILLMYFLSHTSLSETEKATKTSVTSVTSVWSSVSFRQGITVCTHTRSMTVCVWHVFIRSC